MHVEYLLFDLAVLLPILALSIVPGDTFFVHRWSKALVATALSAAPWLAWDVAVEGWFWTFADERVLGPRVLGLPLEEWGFFFVVPFACLYTWEVLLKGPREQPRPRPWAVAGLSALALAGGLAMLATTGRVYTGAALISLAAGLLFDAALGAPVLGRRRGWGFLAVVAALTVAFDNVLTGLPVVIYDPAVHLGWRVFTMPIEDLGFGLGHLLVTASLYQRSLDRVARDPSDGWVARLIRWRFGGYRHAVVVPDPALPERPSAPRRVLVVGGGLAGIGAAEALAARGFEVVLRERAPYLGGKVGAWKVTLSTGEQVTAEHGFHAFFRQYWNQRDLLARAGLGGDWASIGDYLILTRDGDRVGFDDTSSVPILNLIDLARKGVYSLPNVALSGTGEHLEALLRYDPDRTPVEWDGTSFAEFAERARLPDRLKLVFTTFSRAFFAENRRMSMAELIKSFHFFYLSNDRGLIYDHPTDDYDVGLLAGLERHLCDLGVEIRTGSPVGPIARDDGGGLRVDGERFDHVVVAADVPGTRAVLGASPVLAESPAFAAKLEKLAAGQRYAVLKLWIDRPVERDWPVFVITERERVLDSITLYHRTTAQCRDWARRTGGAVLEAHCYALPDDLPDDAVRDAFLAELTRFVPELDGATVLGEHLQIRDDFPAFHVGAWADRPTTSTGIGGLVLAGDWVRLPWPAMLMEAAQMSALCAANAILDHEGLRRAPIAAVPSWGFLAGLPELPKRHVVAGTASSG